MIGDASNTVAVTLPPLSPTTAGFKDAKVSFDPGRGANSDLANCIRVTGTPVGSTAFSLYKADQTYCPSDFAKKGGGCQGWCQVVEDFSTLVSFVAQVWDYIALAYNTVVDTLITIIAKFNPYCLSASAAAAISESPYADAASEGCEAVAKVVASVVVSVVLSSFGLPARLPTSDQIGEIVEGDLTAIAVAYLEQLGVPCSKMTVDPTTVDAAARAGVEVPAEARTASGDVDVCAAMIGQAVDAIRGEIKKAADAEIANTTGLVIPAEPQRAILEPRGQYQGAEVRLSATPIDAKTLRTARCLVHAKGSVPSIDRGFEGIFSRTIENGYGYVAYNPLSAVGFGEPWRTTLRMKPVDNLNDTETIAVALSSPCFAANALPSIPATPLRPPLGYWYAGQPD